MLCLNKVKPHSNIAYVTLIHTPMLKSYFDDTITITILFTIILYLVLPTLAHSQQQFGFAYQTTIIKNQINDRQNRSMNYRFSASTITGENIDNHNNNSTGRRSTDKVVILNFYDDDKSQFTNAKPIRDKYGFKGTFFIVCNWANSDNNSRMTWQIYLNCIEKVL